MSERSKLLFLLLVIVQAAHSVEEYLGRLYEVFAPARYLAGLVSDDLAAGFIVINLAIFLLGAGCYLLPVRSGLRAGRVVAWSWSWVEVANGIGHVLIAASMRGYFPGALTGAALMVSAPILAASLILDKRRFARHSAGIDKPWQG